MAASDPNETFRSLHDAGFFIMPNPWDIGSAKMLESLGFAALATTSAGHAQSLGRHDRDVTRDELLAHVNELAAAVAVPLNVDSERLFGSTPEEVAATVTALADAGAAGCSIEDYDPALGAVEPLDAAIERVAAAAEAAETAGMVLTARCESHLSGPADLEQTIERLLAYSAAGAHALYAPGLSDIDEIARVVEAVDRPLNVLALPNVPAMAELEAVGVRRVSTGSLLARVAMGAAVAGARELLDVGTSTYTAGAVAASDLRNAFG